RSAVHSATELDAPLFPSAGDRNTCTGKNDQSRQRHCIRIRNTAGEHSFDISNAAGEQNATLVGKSRQKATDVIGGKLRYMGGHNAPGSLHTKLQQKSPGSEHSGCWRERPQGNDKDGK